MNRDGVNGWLERYVAAWKSYDRNEIEALFTDEARYRFHPWDEPIVGRGAIADAWLEDRDEPGSFDASYECYATGDARAVAVGSSTYFAGDGSVDRVYDNVYLLRFDEDGRCSEFMEWFMKRP